MKLPVLALLAFTLIAGMSHAQERTAAGPADTQMTWTALSNSIRGVSDRTDAVNTRVDQVVVCARKGMVYAPGQTGSDAQGCFQPATDPSVTTSITNLNNVTTNITNCAKAGKVYNKITNVCEDPTGGNNQLTYVTKDGSGSRWGRATCPAGTNLIGCLGGLGTRTYCQTIDRQEYYGSQGDNARQVTEATTAVCLKQ